MNTRALHSITALLLMLIIQLPGLMQLEHSFHEHEETHYSNDNGDHQNIYTHSDENCSTLHQLLNINFTFEIKQFEFTFEVDYYISLSQITSNFSLQLLPFTKLRAPPFMFFID